MKLRKHTRGLYKPKHPLRVTIWCGLGSGCIIGLHFFENKNGVNITVNGDAYRNITTVFIVPAVHGIDVNDVWLQTYGITPYHISHVTIALLYQTFDGLLLSQNGVELFDVRYC